MARGFDELIEHLLAEVSFCGDEGATVADFQAFVNAFYADDPVTVDINLLKKVWHWLLSHSELRVEGDANDPDLGFLEVSPPDTASAGAIDPLLVDDEQAAGGQEPGAGNAAAGGDSSTKANVDQPSPPRRGDDIRIHTSQERVWLALTGHGVSWSKVPRMEFDLLTIIARSREKGITQPELVRLTGQDKRSVPKRTTSLANHGYITKETVAGHRTRTSLLTHKRFKKEETELSSDAVFVNGDLILRKFWDFIFGLFEKQRVISMQDLRRMLEVDGKRLENRRLWRAQKHLAKLGLIDIVKVPWQVDGKEMNYTLQSIRLLRNPTPTDRAAFLMYKKQEQIGVAREVLDDEDEDAGEGQDAVDDVDMDNAPTDGLNILQSADLDDADGVPEAVPQWTATQPVNNLLFNLVDAAGKDGLNSTQLAQSSLGTTWTKPLDETVSRLTDAWEESQPQHLRHLSIIRDTKPYGSRGIQYVYRSLAGHQAAVSGGEASWEGVSKTAAKSAGTVLKASELDEWGFPKPSKSAFVDPSGRASLSQCFEAAKIKVEYPSADPVLMTRADGTEYAHWPAQEGDSDAEVQRKAVTAKNAIRPGRKSGGGMFAGVPTTSLEYQRLWREKKREEKLDAAWTLRAKMLAKWRAYQEAYPGGMPPALAHVSTVGTIVKAGRGRPRKNKAALKVQTDGHETVAAVESSNMVLTATTSLDGPNATTISTNGEVLASETSLNNNDIDTMGTENEVSELQAPSKERIAKHLEDILLQKAPGAYYDPPGSRRKNLPPSTPYSVLVIKTNRLRELDLGPDIVETASTEPAMGRLSADPGHETEDPSQHAEEATQISDTSEAPETTSTTDPASSQLGAVKAVSVDTTNRPNTSQSWEGTSVTNVGTHSLDALEPTLTNDYGSSTAPKRSEALSGAALNQRPQTPEQHDRSAGRGNAAGADIGSVSTQQPTEGPVTVLGRSNIEEHTASGNAATSEDDTGHLRPTEYRESESDEPRMPAVKDTKSKMRSRQGVLLGGGSVARTRSNILQDMLERCGGVIPGGSDLVAPFVAAFLSRVSDAATPDRETVLKAVKNLRDQGAVKYFDFPLTGRNGKRVDKRIIALKTFSSTSPALKELMKRMQEAHPQPYVPAAMWEPGTAPHRAIWTGQNTASRKIPKDMTTSVPVLQPSDKQLEQARRAAEREAQRQAKASARAAAKAAAQAAKDEAAAAKATAAAQKARMGEQRKAEKEAARLENLERGRKRSKKRKASELVDYQAPSLPPPLTPQHGPTVHENGFAHIQPMDHGESSNDMSIMTPGQSANEGHAGLTWLAPNQPHGTMSTQMQRRASRPGDLVWLDPELPNVAAGTPLGASMSSNSTPFPRDNGAQIPGAESNEELDSGLTPERATKRRKVAQERSTSHEDSRTPIRFSSEMTEDQLLMLLHTHAAVKVLICGLDGAVNWNIIDYVFRNDPAYSKPVFRSKFNTLTKSRPDLMEGMIHDFQICYIAAYEAGEVPTVDYARMEETDWDAIVEWSIRTVTLSTGGLPKLPLRQQDFERAYALDQARVHIGRERGRFSKDNISELNRTELLHSLPLQLLHPSSEDAVVELSLRQPNGELQRLRELHGHQPTADACSVLKLLQSTDPHLALMIVKSGIRASIFTPEQNYRPLAAQEVLASFPDQLVHEARDQLYNGRVTTKKRSEVSETRSRDGQRLDAVDTNFENALRGYCYIEPVDLEVAVACKAKLDEAFAGGAGSFSFGFNASDGLSLATTNLVAMGQIKIVARLPPFDDTIGAPLPTISKWGWNAGEYKGAKTDQMSMEMVKLELEPTAAYEPGIPAELRQTSSFPTPPPMLGADGQLRLYPLWVNIHGDVMWFWWRRLVCYVVQTVHLRPYIGTVELTEQFRGLVWQWEIELLLEWAETNGLIMSADLDDDRSTSAERSWRATQCWWFCLYTVGGSSEE